MTAAGKVIDNVLRAMRREESASERERLWKRTNTIYFQLCREHSWHKLRRTSTIDFNSATSAGVWLPANMMGIDRVRDTDNGFEYVRRDRADEEPDEDGYRYYTFTGSTTPAFESVDGLDISHGSSSFTCTGLSEDHTDEYVVFGSEPGLYKLTSQLGFEPKYYGPDLASDNCTIRPKETEKMVILDRSENVLDDRTVELHYWEAPEPLYRESDIIVLPISSPLELSLLIDAVGVVGKRQIAADRYRAEFRAAWDRAVELNPAFPRIASPRDRHNQLFSLSENIFGRRS